MSLRARSIDRLHPFPHIKAVAISVIRRAADVVVAELNPRRLFSFPHLLICIWIVVLLWGERWVFGHYVRACRWDRWEDWPGGSTPHRLVLIADPQIIDAFSYPHRAWPYNPLIMTITDNFMRRSFVQLERHLWPDTIFFLGDNFDGGREWRTHKDPLDDLPWAPERPRDQLPYAQWWRTNFGQKYWLDEYVRFGALFFTTWNQDRQPGGQSRQNRRLGKREALAPAPAPAHTCRHGYGHDEAGECRTSRSRGRKMIASLPGNHDLGFGAMVRVSVRDRFAAYFGEGNRIDMVGNHTVVSVDSVSLSAGAGDMAGAADVRYLHYPTEIFLHEARAAKRRAVEQELRFWYGNGSDPDVAARYSHHIHDLNNGRPPPEPDPAVKKAEPVELPTILLTHVPLHRAAGTPCGPLRERWPPVRPPPDHPGPVQPDPANAIRIGKGYQYQNVLSEEHSQMMIREAGNVVHVFSGDDHDYCDIVHTGGDKAGIREITVKSFSMAMGVSFPAFLMVSLFNPIGPDGGSLRPANATTLQTHLCILPRPLAIYLSYGAFSVFSFIALIVRAILVSIPTSRLVLFSTRPATHRQGGDASGREIGPPPCLPLFQDRAEYGGSYADRSTPARGGHSTGTEGTARVNSGPVATTRSRSASFASRLRTQRPSIDRPVRIDVSRNEFFATSSRSAGRRHGLWTAAATRLPGRRTIGLVARETGLTVLRVAAVGLLFFAYLVWNG